MAEEKNILLDNLEEQSKGSAMETLLDSVDVRDEQVNKLDTMFAQIQEHYQKGEYEQVLGLTEEALKLDPSNGNLVLLMGLVNRDAGKKVQAVHWFRKALNDFGMVEAEVELMRLYQTGIAGAEYKAKAEEYFANKEETVSEEENVSEEETVSEEEIVSEEESEEKSPIVQEESDCTYPAPGTPFYTVEEYKEFLEKYPNMSEGERVELAAKQGRGFGYQYMSIAQAAVQVYDKMIWSDWNNLRVTSSRYQTRGASSAETAKTLNSVNNFVRQDVAKTMQNYLENHNKTIDCWPVSETGSGFMADNTGEGTRVQLNFDYFSDDFKVVAQKDGQVITRDARKFFRNGYKIENPKKPQELIDIEEKIQKLEKVPVYTEQQRKKSIRHFVTSLLPLVLLLLNVLGTHTLSTGKDLFGIGTALIAVADKISGLWNAGIVGKILAFIPMLIEGLIGMVMMLVYAIARIFNAEGIAAVILAIASLILGYGAYEWCMNKLGESKGLITRKDVQAGKEASAEADRLRNDQKTKELREEYLEMCNKTKEEARQLSEHWHRKWYDACVRKDS